MTWGKLEEPKVYSKLQAPTISTSTWEFRIFSSWPVRNLAIIASILTFVLWYGKYYNYHTPRQVSPEPSWDFLLFTQSYPFTCCVWNEVVNDRKSCHYSSDPHAWTIHGIWPTQNNTEGPEFCKGNKFNKTALENIRADLDNHWPSIESKSGLQFWKHEWEKHGTCAAQVPTVCNSELAYFQRGLDWNREYNLTKALTAAGIIPSNVITYSRQQLIDAIKSAWKTIPQLDCFNYVDLGVFLINEIRLCIKSDLKLMDCDVAVTKTNTCPDEGILYAENLSFRDLLKR